MDVGRLMSAILLETRQRLLRGPGVLLPAIAPQGRPHGLEDLAALLGNLQAGKRQGEKDRIVVRGPELQRMLLDAQLLVDLVPELLDLCTQVARVQAGLGVEGGV